MHYFKKKIHELPLGGGILRREAWGTVPPCVLQVRTLKSKRTVGCLNTSPPQPFGLPFEKRKNHDDRCCNGGKREEMRRRFIFVIFLHWRSRHRVLRFRWYPRAFQLHSMTSSGPSGPSGHRYNITDITRLATMIISYYLYITFDGNACVHRTR